jgi:Flp pilus assembly protein TadG
MKRAIHQTIDFLKRNARAFVRAKRGNVAMMFGIAAVPLMIAVGAGVDFFRAAMVKNAMNEAIDAAALAIGSTPGLTQTTAKSLAQQYFDANYTADVTSFGKPQITAFNYDSTKGTVSITVTDQMPATVLKVAGYTQVPISASSTVVWGQSKIWVSLVLDSSGSMAQGDSSGSKMDALQNALTTSSTGLLAILQNAASNAGDVQVSIVPFVKNVNMGTSNVNAAWLDWTDWASPPLVNGAVMTDSSVMPVGSDPLNTFGPGDSCPFDGSDGYKCAPTNANDTKCYTGGGSDDCIATIPTSGTYKGYICPSMHIGGTTDGLGYHWYNGCWVATTASLVVPYVIASGSGATCKGHSSSNCSCTGSKSATVCSTKIWNHTWVANNHSTWGGCVMDRQRQGQTTNGASSSASVDYDITNTLPNTSNSDTRFPAENNLYCNSAKVTPLEYNWSDLNTQVNALNANGATNQAIGMEHGWQSLTPGLPYGAPAVPANTTRYIIILSDGLNTMDRWYGDGSTESTTADGYIDTRMNSVCSAAKADGVIIYSIYVNIGGKDGNSAPLQNCATDSTKFFALTSTSAVVTTFNQIAQQITNVRVSQ